MHDCAAEDFLVADDSISPVEEDHNEDFMVQDSELQS